jgi:hypothetical protein
MATKKKTKKKSTGSKKSAARKPPQPTQKRLAKKKTVQGKPVAGKKAPAKTKRAPAKTRSAKAVYPTRRNKYLQLDSLEPSPVVSGLESGDLEGLSNVESADSESVDELLEEGNAFEAGVVWGVEDSRDRTGEVRTREVPEDDVPQEYLDDD